MRLLTRPVVFVVLLLLAVLGGSSAAVFSQVYPWFVRARVVTDLCTG